MFYTGVPSYRVLLFGSFNGGDQRPDSDLDFAIDVATLGDLQHPYFQDLIGRLRPHCAELGGVLDLFVVDHAGRRFVAVFDERRSLDGGEDFFAELMQGACALEPWHWPRLLRFAQQNYSGGLGVSC